ncbi:hypothetical protein ACP4OV_002929 [Aristida adscensionis]
MFYTFSLLGQSDRRLERQERGQAALWTYGAMSSQKGSRDRLPFLDVTNTSSTTSVMAYSHLLQSKVLVINLHVQVIDAYIALIRVQEHLKHKTGGSAYLETACISQVLKRDGSKKVKMVNMYPRRDEREIQFLKKRICNYLNHDIVLDSMGVVFGRKDLRIVLKGLQRQINILSKYKELKNHKWTNLKVETWPIREIRFKGEMQTAHHVASLC